MRRRLGLIFDLDGTLIDSAAAICAGLRLALAAVGLPDPGEARLRATIGTPLDQVLAESLGIPAAQHAAAKAAYRGAWRTGLLASCRLFAQVDDCLQGCRAAGHLLAVATAKEDASAQLAIDRHRLRGFFTTDTTCGVLADDPPGKIAVVGRAVARLRAAGAADLLFVGDAESDAIAAVAHRLPFVWCRYGCGPADLPQRQPVWRCLDQAGELLALLDDEAATPA